MSLRQRTTNRSSSTLETLDTALDSVDSAVDSIANNEKSSEDAEPKISSANMTVASKEVTKSSTNNDGIFSIIYSVFKKLTLIGGVYFIGYMGWSFGWLVAPIILIVTRDQMRQSRDAQRQVAQQSAMANEKDVILSRLTDLPAWVYFPDIERCEWLNKILLQVWPNANHFAADFVKHIIEPKVAKAVNKGFKFDRIILGTIPPRIGGIKVYDKNVSRNEIIMDVDLHYASNCDINFQVAALRGGIKDFHLSGIVRVVMKPLISKIPLVGGLQIYFLNNPDIDFNLVGVADVLDMPGLSDLLRKIIVEQIGAFMVLPNKLPITLNDSVPANEIKMSKPEGVLRIHVIEAKNLMKKDISVLGKGKSDPYAIINVGSQQFRTKTIDNNVNPIWNFWCEATIQSEIGQFLLIQLMDADNASDDEKLGSASVEISSVVKKGIVDTWINLEHAKHGMVHLRLYWMSLSNKSDDLQAALMETQQLRIPSMASALLVVFIDSASELPQARPQSKPDPYVIVTFGKHTNQTSIKMRTDGPVWEEDFTYLVNNPDNDTLQLVIKDQKTDKEIGRLTYNLNALLKKRDLQVISEPFQLQKSGPVSKINLSLVLRILKPAQLNTDVSEDDDSNKSNTNDQNLYDDVSSIDSLSSSTKTDSTATAPIPPIRKQNSKMSESNIDTDSGLQEDLLISSTINQLSSSPQNSQDGTIISDDNNDNISETQSSGSAGLGRIQLTLRYTVQRQRLIVLVHRIINIPIRDSSNVPDPYVKLYLLPGRNKESKRKTFVVKDNVNPIYDQSFEYMIAAGDLMTTELEVTVATQKGFILAGNPVIGMLKIPLSDPEISQQGMTSWYDLLSEGEFD